MFIFPLLLLYVVIEVSGFRMIIKGQLLRSESISVSFCLDVTQFGPVMKFDPAPLIGPNIIGPLVMVTVLCAYWDLLG